MWRDDGLSGDFSPMFETNVVLASAYLDIGVETSNIYRYKYRARNVNGFGEFSEPGLLFAASPPSQPEPPTRVSFDSSGFTVQLYTPASMNGNDATSYELYMD